MQNICQLTPEINGFLGYKYDHNLVDTLYTACLAVSQDLETNH